MTPAASRAASILLAEARETNIMTAERATNWTPGPYVVDEMFQEHDAQVRISAYDGRDDYYHRCPTIAVCWFSDKTEQKAEPNQRHISLIAAEATARLFAAAPELHAALKQAVHALEYASRGEPAGEDLDRMLRDIDAAKAALAKAEGR